MLLPHGATIAVIDGEKLRLFRNTGKVGETKLVALEEPALGSDNKSSGARHGSSAGNPDDSRLEEDSFVVAVAGWLNTQALGHGIDALAVIAAPKSLGELRKHYHKALEAKLVVELAKDLTGHSIADIEAALEKA
ncbi:host attachment family protein [Plastoroseomonas arctica]|uniref:Host cell attachment protein n=1 Tax=Plastoroseomonas arctica TaxID=1509237 RepID=A0AAF1KKF6_9PROT|nr:host attachment protein [Plastoroseomonas arctica]MBR0656475.1 host cell attachment protein [Plastoroseomonas arctica]